MAETAETSAETGPRTGQNGPVGLAGRAVAPVAPPAGPRLPRREVWVDLPEDYAGLRVRLWVNYPNRLVAELQSGEQARMAAALGQIVVEHNGWCESDGTPFPPAREAQAFWDAIPTELAAVVLALVHAESSRLPNSLLPTNRR